MITNIESIEELASLARQRSREYESKSVKHDAVERLVKDGWNVESQSTYSTRLARQKNIGCILEDRVWRLFYRMRFPTLSREGGAKLLIDGQATNSPATQIDVFAADEDVALAIECKASDRFGKRISFQEELAKHALIRSYLPAALKKAFPDSPKKTIVLAIFLSNADLSENDRARAKQANVLLFDEHDLSYYEDLTGHLGPAARYQFLADMLPGKSIPGLTLRLPAIKTKMGGFNCFTFSIIPDYLLKVAYVSHRAKGKGSDIIAYQRMLTKARLSKIRKYVSEDGIFPTNIVVNFDKSRLSFERIHQEGDSSDNGVAGWLTLRPAYKSAWIIDGQHRLFAYSGLPEAHTGKLSVLAFEGLEAAEQARLFIDINARQKKVKQSLLEELYSDLHWEAEEESVRVVAIVSKAVQDLGILPSSPFFQRIQTSESTKDVTCCISLNSLFKAVSKSHLYIVKERHGKALEYGPLWTGKNDSTLKRTISVLSAWFDAVRKGAPDWWEKGSDDGGGLAMNDAVVGIVMVLKTVCQHLDSHKLHRFSDDDLNEVLAPFSAALGSYLGSLSEDERRTFRNLRGGQGQSVRMRQCQAGIRRSIATFNPDGLDKFLEEEKLQTNLRGKEIIDRIERTLKKTVLAELKAEFGESEIDWWMQGVPAPIRKKVSERFEDDKAERGGRENYFDLLDYFKIASEQWKLFEPLLAFEKSGKKEQRLGWIERLNKFRNALAHPSSGVTLSLEELSQIERYDAQLQTRLSAATQPDSIEVLDEDED